MGAEYSQLDHLSYPEATTLMKKYRGSAKRSYPVNKVQIAGLKNIPYARYVPLSDRKTDEYKSMLYTPKLSRRNVKSPDDSFGRSKSSMPAPGRHDAAEVTFVRGASIRKSRRGRAKSAFVPQNEKELALSKIYIKPTDLVVEQPKPKKPTKKSNGDKKKRFPFFKIKKKNQVQPSAVYIEPGKQKKKGTDTNNVVKPFPKLTRQPSLSSRPSTQGSLRQVTRSSLRRRTKPNVDVSFSSNSTALSLGVHGQKTRIFTGKPKASSKTRDSDSFSSVSEDELLFTKAEGGATESHNGDNIPAKLKSVELFQAKGPKSLGSQQNKKNNKDKRQRPYSVHGYPNQKRNMNRLNILSRPKTTTQPGRTQYGIFQVGVQRPNTSESRGASRASTASGLKVTRQPNNSPVMPQRKSFENSVHPFGKIVSKRPVNENQKGKLQKGVTPKMKAPQKPKIRLKWYTVLQRTHYEKKVDSLYTKHKSAFGSRDNTCTEDEVDVKQAHKPFRSEVKQQDRTSGYKMGQSPAVTRPEKTNKPRPQSAKSEISVAEDKPLDVIEYDADLESDMEKVNANKHKNTPMMARRAKARQALSNALNRSNSRRSESVLTPKPSSVALSVDKSPRSVRFQSPHTLRDSSRSRRDSSRYRAEERKLQMYADSTSSSDEEEDEILKRMSSHRLSPASRADSSLMNALSPKPLAPSWLSDSNPDLNHLKDEPDEKPKMLSSNRKQKSFLKDAAQSILPASPYQGFVKQARTMFEYSPPTPDLGHVVTIQGCAAGNSITVKPSTENKSRSFGLEPKPASSPSPDKRFNANQEGRNPISQPKHLSDVTRNKSSTTGGLPLVENQLSWTPTLGRQSRKDNWDRTKSYPNTNSSTSAQKTDGKSTPGKFLPHGSDTRAQEGTNSVATAVDPNKPATTLPKKTSHTSKPSMASQLSIVPVRDHVRSRSRENRLTVNTDMFGSKYRRERSNPRTSLVRSTGIYSNNYEGVGNSSQGQGVTLPKLVTDEGYDAYARTAPTSTRPREFSPMNWARHGTGASNSRPARQQGYICRGDSQERKPAHKDGNNVFKQILQSMLENTQTADSTAASWQEKRAETAPANMRRRDTSVETFLPAVVNNTPTANNLVECTKL